MSLRSRVCLGVAGRGPSGPESHPARPPLCQAAHLTEHLLRGVEVLPAALARTPSGESRGLWGGREAGVGRSGVGRGRTQPRLA